MHSKDVMPYLLDPKSFKLERVLQAPLYVVNTARLETSCDKCRRARSTSRFVVDELAASKGSLRRRLARRNVGEISDEHEEEVNEQIAAAGEREFCWMAVWLLRDFEPAA